MMKLLKAFAVVAMIGASCAQGAITLDWAYSGNLATAGKGTFQAGWLVVMFSDVSKDNLLSSITSFNKSTGLWAGGNSSEDVLVGAPTTTLQSGKSGINWGLSTQDFTLQSGKNVYSVIFNSASISGATQALIVDSTPFQVPSVDTTGSYTQSSVANNWVGVVPEPGTMALLGIGAAVIGLRKRIRR